MSSALAPTSAAPSTVSTRAAPPHAAPLHAAALRHVAPSRLPGARAPAGAPHMQRHGWDSTDMGRACCGRARALRSHAAALKARAPPSPHPSCKTPRPRDLVLFVLALVVVAHPQCVQAAEKSLQLTAVPHWDTMAQFGTFPI